MKVVKKEYQWVRDRKDRTPDPTTRRDISRSERKRDQSKVDALALSLLALPEAHLNQMNLSADLRACIQEAKRLESKPGVRGGLRRQKLRLAGLVRREDEETIAALLEEVEERSGPNEKELMLQDVEQWRERIVSKRDEAIGALVAAYPGADRQRLRQLALAVDRERKRGAKPKAFRQLFALVREIISSHNGPEDSE